MLNSRRITIDPNLNIQGIHVIHDRESTLLDAENKYLTFLNLIIDDKIINTIFLADQLE